MLDWLFRRKLTRKRFAERFRRQLEAQPGFVDIRYEPTKFQLVYRGPNGQSGISHLGNAYTDACKALPAEVDGVVGKYILAVVEGGKVTRLAEQLDRLMPLIRDRAYFSIAELALKAGDLGGEVSPVPWLPLVDDYGMAVAVDSENSLAPVSAKQLAEAGLTLEEALERAISNLRSLTVPNFTALEDGVYVSGWHDVYDAARLLLPELLHQLPLRGAPVAAIPSRNHLLVTGDRDVRGLNRIIELAAQVAGSDTRPTSPSLLTVQGGQWRLFEMPGLDEAPLREVRRRILHDDYREQGKLLDDWLKTRGEDVFVASILTVKGKDGSGDFSAVTWSQGVDTLLPMADRLILYLPEAREIITIAWASALPFVGHRLIDQGMYPPRYRVRSFPDQDELNAIRRNAIDIGTAR